MVSPLLRVYEGGGIDGWTELYTESWRPKVWEEEKTDEMVDKRVIENDQEGVEEVEI